MRIPKRGEKGFTLIELLIVVAILGVLAAVIIPNVSRFFGKGEEEARKTEKGNVQLAMDSMMLDNEIDIIPNPVDSGTATNDMGAFPDVTSDDTDPPVPPATPGGKTIDPEGFDYACGVAPLDKAGYRLYGHDITGSGSIPANPETADVNYMRQDTTEYYYTCDPDGTVHQYESTATLVEL